MTLTADITLDRIRATRGLLAGRIHHTPMLSSATAARVALAATGHRVADDRLYLKAENLQKTGSFKPRAALSRIASLSPGERSRGAITISAGNAGQAYAWAGREAGVPVTVVMPAGAVRSKVEACRGYGAEVVLHGEHVGETLAKLEELREARGLTVVHPFDQPEVVIGNGSLGLELLEDLPDVDVLIAGVGGGGLISGVTAAVKAVRPGTRIYGVEPVGSDALKRSIAAGEPVTITPRSVADGLNAPFGGRLAIEICGPNLEDIVLLEDATILGGLRFALERLKLVLEPAGATALAAVLSGAIPYREGDRVAVILSGGNVAIDRLGELLAQAAPLPGARVTEPDPEPGPEVGEPAKATDPAIGGPTPQPGEAQWRSRDDVLRDELAALVGPPPGGVAAPDPLSDTDRTPAVGPPPPPRPPVTPASPAWDPPPIPSAPVTSASSGWDAPTAMLPPPTFGPSPGAVAAIPAAPGPFASPFAALPAESISGPPPAPPARRSPFADIPITPRKVVPAAFDLLMSSQRDLRNASFYVGFLVLTMVGPAVALFWGLQARFGGGLEDALSGSSGAIASFLVLVAVSGFFIAVIESRTLAIAVLAGRVEGRPLSIGGAVTLVRRRFWRAAVAGFLVGLLSSLSNVLVGAALPEPQISLPVSLIVGVLVEAPFVYAIGGIVLGEVGVREALGRSTRLFGVRKRLAVTVSLFGIASQLALILALFAGLDVVVRIVDAIGLGGASFVSTFAAILVAGALLFALGTLLFTAAALAAAPQVLAFTGLTHYARGLEPGRHTARGRWPWDPFVTRGLAVTIGATLLLLFVGIGALRG